MEIEPISKKLARAFRMQYEANKKLRRKMNMSDINNKKIRVLKPNPKKKGTKAFASFEVYKDGMTVAEYCFEAIHGRRNISNDIKKGFIELYE